MFNEISRSEIEKEIRGKGDYVQIDYLTKLLKKEFPIDTKKFICLSLAKIYERKMMFSDAAKMFDNIAMISVAFSEKINNYIKETELYIKAGFFARADEAMKKAMNQANASEKQDICFVVKDTYKRQARVYEKDMKRNHAVRIYEKLLDMNISETERNEIKKKLLELYEKLGKFNEMKGL